MTAGRLFVARHGRTACNGESYVGWGNPMLDTVGLRQAEDLLAALRAVPLDVVYCSPLGRATATARPVADFHRAPLIALEELREIHYGAFQGLRKAERPLKLRRQHRREPMPGGESLQDLYVRVRDVAARLRAEAASGRHVLVVAHFWTNRMLVGTLRQMPFDQIVDAPPCTQANGSLIEIDPGVLVAAPLLHTRSPEGVRA